MKHFILINGTMGIGKTATSKELCKILPPNAFLDGDWCWASHPFVVTNETQSMVKNNIKYLLNNFIACSAYEYVIFCWVMHDQEIVDEICEGLNLDNCFVHKFTLTCSEAVLKERLNKDISLGIREPDILQRSMERLPLYYPMDTVKVNVDDMTAIQAAAAIKKMIFSESFI